MDRLEAYAIARRELEALRAGLAGALRPLIGRAVDREVRGVSGAEETVVVRVTLNASSIWKLERLEERSVLRP
jgi:hypothetical protein